MILTKRSLVLNYFLLLNAKSIYAESLRKRRNLGGVDLSLFARFHEAGKKSSDDSSAENDWDVMAQDLQMSMPGPTGATQTGPPTTVPGPTDVPTTAQNTNGFPELTLDAGDDPVKWTIPECHGACRETPDCLLGLVCFEREAGPDVPGCFGNADNLGDGSQNFCIDPNKESGWDCSKGWCPNPNGYPPLVLDPTDPEKYSQKECHADCDQDTDCEFGLICYQRDLWTQDVPGCYGNADAIGDGFHDFCVKPPAWPVGNPIPYLVVAGDEGFPVEAFPLGECQGDCDEDADCAAGLACFQRDGAEAIPGCQGLGALGLDYCWDLSKATASPTATVTGAPTLTPGNTAAPSPTGIPLDFAGNPVDDWGFYELTECQGDCDYDSDCDVGLVCWFRDTGDDGQVPGCIGDANTLGGGSDDYCVKPQSANRLVIMGDDDGTGFLVYPLGNCQGECDEDGDCAGDLKCFLRSGLEEIPGCVGEGEEGYDYCASFSTPTLSPGQTSAPSVTPVGIPLDFAGDPAEDWGFYELNECQGDCDYDSDCDIGLVCSFRDGSDNGQVPGCIGDANTINDGSDDFCTKPQTANRLVIMGDDDGTGFLVYPLGNCQGECDEDADCAGDLKCFLRSDEEAVPGCIGVGEVAYDYCASF